MVLLSIREDIKSVQELVLNQERQPVQVDEITRETDQGITHQISLSRTQNWKFQKKSKFCSY